MFYSNVGRLIFTYENENILLHTVYNNIIDYLSGNLCIVTTETGKFIYNITSRQASKEYEDIFYASHKNEYNNYENHFFYKLGDKYGIIGINGNVILPAKYECYKYPFGAKLEYYFNDYNYEVFIKDGLLYGVIQINEYDNCIRIGNKRNGFYITELHGKFGLLSNKRSTIVEPCFDDIILYKKYDKSGFHQIITGDKRSKKWVILIFVIAKKGDKYWLYNVYTGKCYLKKCDNISFHDGLSYNSNPYIEFDLNGVHGYVMSGGVTLTLNDYDDIDIDEDGIIITKNNKKGLLNVDGYELLPCSYDSIQRKGLESYLVIKDGIQEILDFRVPNYDDCGFCEKQHYGRYSGSYAQNEMGYSDEDIDTIFDGDPDAYWNID